MKTTITTIIVALLFSSNLLFAQNEHFTKSGIIEFEKTVNMYAMIQKEITPDNEAFFGPILESYKKTQPQFRKVKSTLTFGDNKSLYAAVPNDNGPGGFFTDDAMSGQPNTVFNDLETRSTATQKKVYEEIFLVKDSTRKITWKITDETREIAGFTCRRANALVMDSIYVVAFYTESITVPAGPESFTGLPGMILGVALPHENVTWFATKVTEKSIEPKDLMPPKKGKVVSNKELYTTLKQVMKNWGPSAQLELKALLL
ncbi:GLPGLI family protein [Mucilaginibacter sp. BJC16-A38]|uniref:GLPGLI family protein n=1 Tax=Mucilaginibacter phenanthrenivorans TaxID=1234842 RepID=UPI002158532D|nr:GLPGLI family protein [Mucilaginibacter phenanthrenivorans]MCR8559028.1 GLPGLI family protein [Mucilaginibacter phenanthrenivorans]